MRIPVATSPTSWGVDYADHPSNPPWEGVLDGIAAAGYRRLELGPVGYLPEDPATLRAELAKRALRPVGTFIFERLDDLSQLEGAFMAARRTSELIHAVGGQYLVIVPHPHRSRAAVAGNSAAAKRLNQREWQLFISAIKTVARIADDRGVRAVLHPHAGTFVEYEDEIDAAVEALGPESIGLCVDSGHALYAGVDPARLVRKYANRVEHIHLKDLNVAVRDRRLNFDAAIAAGIFCPLGKGSVDFPAFASALSDIGYRGVATVEQDRDLGNPSDPLADAAASLAYLERIGFASSERERSPA